MHTPSFKIGRLLLDGNDFTLVSDTGTRSVPPLEYRLLSFLIRNRMRAVSKEEIHDRVWSGRIVSDSAITARIKAVRRLLGDSGERQEYIRTVPRHGYQFVADVEEVEPASVETVASVPAAELFEAPIATTDARKRASRSSIVVLPIAARGDASQSQLLCDGLINDLITRLARTKSLFVVSRGTSFQLRDSARDPGAAGRRLGVQFVLTGSIQFERQRLRYHAALVDCADGTEVWASRYDRPLRSILNLQDELAGEVVRAVEQEVRTAGMRMAMVRSPQSIDAWTAFHRGLWHMFRTRHQDLERAAGFFATAAELDPADSRVQACLSFTNWQLVFHEMVDDRENHLQLADQHAQRAADLDSSDPLAHFAIGRVQQLRRRHDAAMRSLQTALDLNPNLALAHYAQGLIGLLDGDYAESSRSLDAALELSPLDPMAYAVLGSQAITSLARGDTATAERLSAYAADLPNAQFHRQIQFIASVCSEIAGHRDTARERLDRLHRIAPDFTFDTYTRALPVKDTELLRDMRHAFDNLSAKSRQTRPRNR